MLQRVRKCRYRVGIITRLVLFAEFIALDVDSGIWHHNQPDSIISPAPLPLLLVLGFAVLILCIVSIFVIRHLCQSLCARQQEVELLRLEDIEEQNRLHRQYRHDLYNHLMVISGLAQLGRLDKLMEYWNPFWTYESDNKCLQRP